MGKTSIKYNLLGLAVLIILFISLAEAPRLFVSADEEQPNTYIFRNDFNYNATEIIDEGSTWLICWDSGAMEYTPTNTATGDWREDGTFLAPYYIGTGIILEITLSENTTLPTNVTISEENGKEILFFSWSGNDRMYLTGYSLESKDSNGDLLNSEIYGTEILDEDWRSGIWNPDSGIRISIEDGEFVVNSSILCTMIMLPDYLIPEYPILIGVVSVAVVLILLHTPKRLSTRNDI